jgi:hypothetical protein
MDIIDFQDARHGRVFAGTAGRSSKKAHAPKPNGEALITVIQASPYRDTELETQAHAVIAPIDRARWAIP